MVGEGLDPHDLNGSPYWPSVSGCKKCKAIFNWFSLILESIFYSFKDNYENKQRGSGTPMYPPSHSAVLRTIHSIIHD